MATLDALLSMEDTHSLKSKQHQKQVQPSVFEFTKRRRWADILVSEAPDLALFVLNPQGKIWYSGPGVGELLGWKVGELVDEDVSKILNGDDIANFRKQLSSCALANQQLSTYVRLKCRPDENSTVQKELLFELRGKPVSADKSNDCLFLVLSAKPYPSKNMAIVNTILELKMEHEQLEQRLADLREQQAGRSPFTSLRSTNSPVNSTTPQFSQLAFNSVPSRSSDGFSHDRGAGMTMDIGSSCGIPGAMTYVHALIGGDEEDEDGTRRRLKRPFSPEHQFVCYTCGRTDSPEWRKGPQGPKTLCNACGLRWAKRSKNKPDPSATATPSTSVSTGDNAMAPQQSMQGQQQQYYGSHPPHPTRRRSNQNMNPPAPHPALSCTPPSATSQSRAASMLPSPLHAHPPGVLASPASSVPLLRDVAQLPPPVPPGGNSHQSMMPATMYSSLQQALESNGGQGGHGDGSSSLEMQYSASFGVLPWSCNDQGYGF